MELCFGLGAGLVLFLLGLDYLTQALKQLAGDMLRIALARLTSNRFLAALTGAVVTAAVNSSSVTTVLVVGFVTAGVMSMAQSVGVIMGANIGSTITAQLVAFDLGVYSLIGITVGFLMSKLLRSDRWRHGGEMLFGLGLVFFGMTLMSDSMYPLRTYEPFINLMGRMEQPVLGVVVGAVFTGLVQSSAATTGIAIALASQGILSLPAGIALALGANIGTCATALLAAIGKPREAVRVAVVHVLFNVIGVIIWLPFIAQLADLAIWVSPAAGEGAAGGVPRQIANAHTLFNVLNTIVCIGFTGVFATVVNRLLPDKPEPAGIQVQFLDDGQLELPDLACDATRRELVHMGGQVTVALAHLRKDLAEAKITQLAEGIDGLRQAIIAYCGRIRRLELDEDQSRQLQALLVITTALASASELITEDLRGQIVRWQRDGLPVSDRMRSLLAHLGDEVGAALDEAVEAIADASEARIEAVLGRKVDIIDAINEAYAHLAGVLGEDSAHRVALTQFESGVIDTMKHLYSEAKRIAKACRELPALDEGIIKTETVRLVAKEITTKGQ